MKLLLLLLLPVFAHSMDHSHQSLCVNCATIPAPVIGHSDVRLRPTNTVPHATRDNVGSVRTTCDLSHFNHDDPLLYPGRPGAAHLHMWFGNTAGNAFLTPENILKTGNSTCRGGIANRSAYWVPAILDSTDGAVIPASFTHVYYKTGYQLGGVEDRGNERIIPLPAGIRVVAGDGKRTPHSDPLPWYDAKRPSYTIRCNGEGRRFFFDCGPAASLQILINLPQCWDGKNLYLDDQSHMAFSRRARGGCPASHPVVIPEITYTIVVPIPEGRSAENFRLSSDHYSMDFPGGYSMHADWINGWMPGLAEQWTREIINLGLSGGSHHAGGGQMWY